MKNILCSSLTAAFLLAVTSCAAPVGAAPAGSPPAVATPAISASATTSATATATTSATAAATSAALQTFTFPDGHISFSYPAGWTIKTGQGAYVDEASKAGAVEATVVDGSGKEVARVFSGFYGDGMTGPVHRTVLDHAPVPGLTEAAQVPVEFGFALDEIPGSSPSYFMAVRKADHLMPGETSSGLNQVTLPNGVLVAYVVTDGVEGPDPVVPDSGKAWMGTEEYAQLRALLLSLSYT